jgi:membrane-associated protein
MSETGFVQSILDFMEYHCNGLGAVVLFFSSLIEYVFPPFPGDVVTLFGTYLVVQGCWSFIFALSLVTVGSLIGAGIDYWIGVLIGHRLERLPSEKNTNGLRRPLTAEKYKLLMERFRRHGAAYIIINRFLPGIRAFFFVVAGSARMSFWKVILYASISAVLFNSIILAVGYMVGANWEKLQQVFSSYAKIVWGIIVVILLVSIVYWMYKKKGKNSNDI